MNPLFFVLGALALALAAAGARVLWLCRSTAMGRSPARRGIAGQTEHEAALRALQENLDGLAARLDDIEQHLSLAPGAPRTGLNLGKRSQVLRMHRRGDSAEQIAAALEIPLQEVELLLKVHRIVLNSF
jgi:hypothetical protein